SRSCLKRYRSRTIGGGVLRFHPSFFSGSSFGSASLTTRRSRFESGDHEKSETPPATFVSSCASPPARFSSHTCAPSFLCASSPREVRNARYRLSGLQRGIRSLLSGVDVRRTCSAPSQLAIQRSVSRLSFSTSTESTV